MPRRVLITGGSGFVGHWLSRSMLERGWSVFAGSVEGAAKPSVLSASEMEAIHWVPLDVTSDAETHNALQHAEPDAIVHLAGIAYPPDANADPLRTYEVNTLGALRLLEGLSSSRGRARVLMVGTAEQYGPHEKGEYPLAETATCTPITPYAGSKAAQELIALQMSRSRSLEVLCTRSFNHSGAGHGDSYLLPSLVRRARELPREGGALRMGSTTPVRDYLHVADVAEAYLLLLERGVPGEIYNVCSGTGTSVRELAVRVLAQLGRAASIVEDREFVRRSDIPISIGDNSKLRRATGWAPRRTIDDIIDDLIHAAPR